MSNQQCKVIYIYLDKIISFKIFRKACTFYTIFIKKKLITLYNKPQNYLPVTFPRGDRRWYHKGGPQRGGGCSGTCQSTRSKEHLSG